MDIEVEYHELGNSVDAGIEWIIKRYENRYYLITTNSDKTPAKVAFKGFRNGNTAKVLNEKRDIKIVDGTFIDHYKKFDVHIYEIQ